MCIFKCKPSKRRQIAALTDRVAEQENAIRLYEDELTAKKREMEAVQGDNRRLDQENARLTARLGKFWRPRDEHGHFISPKSPDGECHHTSVEVSSGSGH